MPYPGRPSPSCARCFSAACWYPPRFLSWFEGASDASSDDVAARLAWTLWSAPPTDSLREAVSLGTVDAATLLADPRAEGFVDDVAGQWLNTRELDHRTDLPVDVRDAVRRQVHTAVGEVLRGEAAFDDLWTATLPSDPILDAWQGDDDGRTSLLGSGGVMAAHASAGSTSVVRRGVFVLQSLACQPLGEPPPGAALLPTPGATTPAEVAAARQANPACASCHAVIDPVGLALEGVDAEGRSRVQYTDGTPVMATGKLPDGAAADSADAVGRWLAASDDAALCFVRKLGIWVTGHDVGADAASLLPLLRDEGAPAVLDRLLAAPGTAEVSP